MLLAPLFGSTLIAAVAADRLSNWSPSAQEKVAATTPLVHSATDCIVRAVIADPRYGKQPAPDLGDLIVVSMPTCLTPVRAMIAAYDRYYGDGTGEAFFMGPYLDVLPRAVAPRRRTRRHSAATRHQVRLGWPRLVRYAGRVSRLHRRLTRRATARSRRPRACWSGRRARPDPPPG